MYVYLETQGKDGKPTGNYNNRGEVGENDNPNSFAVKMAQKGLKVGTSDKTLGGQVSGEVLDKMGKILIKEVNPFTAPPVMSRKEK